MQDIYNRVIGSIMNFNSKLIVSALVLIATFVLLVFIFPLLKQIWFKICSKKDTEKYEKSLLKKLGNKRFLTFNQWFFLGVFASAFFLFWNINNPPKGVFNRVSQSIIDSLRLFTIENDLNAFKGMFLNKDEPMNGLSNFYLSFFALLAPFCTVTAAVSLLFNDWFVQLKYYIIPFRKAFVLSELNEKSLCLAKDIRKNHPLSLIIFTGVRKNDPENDSDDLLGQVKEINAKTTKRSVTDFHYRLHFRPRIYLIDKEEKNNVKNGKTLFEKYRRKKIIVNVFSTLKSAETFIDNIDKIKAKAEINLINPAQVIAYDLLANYPMFKAADACGSDTMSVLVVGAGHIGMECAKAAMWCGVMKKFKFKINIVDKANRKKEFDSEFVDFENNLSKVGKYIKCRFYRSDFNEKKFNKILKNCDDANYIIVSLGDDEETINTYKKIRQFYMRRAIKNDCYSEESEPVIIPVVRSEIYNDLIKDSKNDKFCPVGCDSEVFKEEVIDGWFIEDISKKIHELYNKGANRTEEYKTLSQTMKRSNRANAVHTIYKLRDMGVCLELTEKGSKTKKEREEDKKDLEDYLKKPDNKPKRDELLNCEHIRWCVFQLLDGWVGVSTDIIKKVNPKENGCYSQKIVPARMHATIAKTDDLERIGFELCEAKDAFTKNDKHVTEIVGKEIIEAIENVCEKDVIITYK